MANNVEQAMATRARRRVFGRPEVGLDRETMQRRMRVGRAEADRRGGDDGAWPNGVADVNPVAAQLKTATDRTGLNG